MSYMSKILNQVTNCLPYRKLCTLDTYQYLSLCLYHEGMGVWDKSEKNQKFSFSTQRDFLIHRFIC